MNRIESAIGRRLSKKFIKDFRKSFDKIFTVVLFIMVIGMMSFLISDMYMQRSDYTIYFGTIVVICMFLIATLAYLYTVVIEMPVEEPSLSMRIEALTNLLRASAKAVSKIEEEIKRTKVWVNKLEEDAATYETITKLKKSEVEAVAQTLGLIVKKEGKKSMVMGILIAAFFFLLGFVVNNWVMNPP